MDLEKQNKHRLTGIEFSKEPFEMTKEKAEKIMEDVDECNKHFCGTKDCRNCVVYHPLSQIVRAENYLKNEEKLSRGEVGNSFLTDTPVNQVVNEICEKLHRYDGANAYQIDASRTFNKELPNEMLASHALHGMAGEVGELHSLYQKTYQGHDFDKDHAKKEVGDLLWFIAEYCFSQGWNLSDVMHTNIEKLKKRYPNGFETNKSLHRENGDI